MNILILEDEIPAYQKLISYVLEFDETCTHDWSRSIAEGRSFLENNVYDFILSDIQLLDGLSFDLFNSVKVTSPIIFCSAHDDYLFEAFNTNGIGYILKPYTETDFKNAIIKYQSLFNQGDYNTIAPSTLDALKLALKDEQVHYKKRFVIKRKTGILLLNVSDISCIQAAGDFCMAIDQNGKKHPISQNIGSLAEQLSPKKFFRINRSEIIHVDFITNIENHFKNRLLVSVKGVSEKIMTSSATTSEFRKWLE